MSKTLLTRFAQAATRHRRHYSIPAHIPRVFLHEDNWPKAEDQLFETVSWQSYHYLRVGQEAGNVNFKIARQFLKTLRKSETLILDPAKGRKNHENKLCQEVLSHKLLPNTVFFLPGASQKNMIDDPFFTKNQQFYDKVKCIIAPSNIGLSRQLLSPYYLLEEGFLCGHKPIHHTKEPWLKFIDQLELWQSCPAFENRIAKTTTIIGGNSAYEILIGLMTLLSGGNLNTITGLASSQDPSVYNPEKTLNRNFYEAAGFFTYLKDCLDAQSNFILMSGSDYVDRFEEVWDAYFIGKNRKIEVNDIDLKKINLENHQKDTDDFGLLMDNEMLLLTLARKIMLCGGYRAISMFYRNNIKCQVYNPHDKNLESAPEFAQKYQNLLANQENPQISHCKIADTFRSSPSPDPNSPQGSAKTPQGNFRD